jgi:Fic family protein
LAKTQVELLQQNVDWAFVFDCNRLTGNNLSYKETLQIISQNKTIAGKSFDEHLEAVNLNQTLLWIRQAANDKLIFNKKLLIDAHIILYNSSANKEAGKYRTQNSTQSSPPAFLVEKLVDDFFESMVIQQNNMHPLLLATQVFKRIMSISPFAMGNEQMAQLMMNFVLLQHQYPLTTFGSDLQSSLTLNSALEKAQSDNTNEDLLLFIINKVKAAYKLHLKLLA